MKRALIISNKIRKIPGGAVETVVRPLQQMGYEVVWAANFAELKVPLDSFPCEILKTESETNPFSPKNLKTRKIILNYLSNNSVDVIFCSTPIGGLHGRLCGRKKGIPTIIYQAHGFLFFKGGPKLGWFYRLIERWLAHYTDALVTINGEDFENAKRFHLRRPHSVFMVNGSGEDYSPEVLSLQEKASLKKSLSLEDNDHVFVSIGELNKNKNVLATVKAFTVAFEHETSQKLLICGEGKEEKYIRRYIHKKKMEHNIQLLGYRTDVKRILGICDCYVSTSLREGLSRTVGESMAAGLPCIVSNKRGLRDWIDSDGGFVFEPRDIKSIANCMRRVCDPAVAASFGKHNKAKVQNFSSESVCSQMKAIFSEVL